VRLTQVREWEEESGLPAPSDTSLYIELGTVQQTSKTVAAWCFAADCDPSTMHSNTWTDQHGRSFPEVDEYRWAAVSEVLRNGTLVKAQEIFLERIGQIVATDAVGAATAATGTDCNPAAGGASGLIPAGGGRTFRGAPMPEGWYAVGEDMAVWQSDPPPGPLPLRSTDGERTHSGQLALRLSLPSLFSLSVCVCVCVCVSHACALCAAGSSSGDGTKQIVAAFDFDDCVRAPHSIFARSRCIHIVCM